MEPNGVNRSSLYSSRGPTMLGIEMPQNQNPQNPHQFSHTQMVVFSQHDSDNRHHPQPPQQNPNSVKGYSFTTTHKSKPSQLSDDDDLGCNPDDGSENGKRKMSPWHRMKWTDHMVMCLIMAAYYIGDEIGSESIDPAAGKKKCAGLLQKKGKWKSVSRAMIDKGFHVSPQQCEDKFNDLNKRYKRVTDILGKGTACNVVENQALLESLDLSPKLKEEVKKLLHSKHLFFKEMCAYHNSFGHSTGSEASGTHHSPEAATRCFHSPVQNMANLSGIEPEHLKLLKGESEDDDDYDEDHHIDDDEDDMNEGNHQNGEKKSSKRAKKESMMQRLNCEMVNVIQDGSKSLREKKQWMKMRLVQLKEQQLRHQMEAFEMEKQRMKWIKFKSNKESEMEKAKVENERKKLENERMALLVRQKEIELIITTNNNSRCRSDPLIAG